MPIARYFVVVGSALAALLLIAGWSLPEPPASVPDRPEIIERAAIRIRSARKWPEKVVLDTSQPTIAPPSIEVAPTEQLVARLPDEMTDQTRADALAKLNPDARPIDAHRRWAASQPNLREKCLMALGSSARGPITSFLFLRYRLRASKSKLVSYIKMG
jgi:hypothetical protein